MVLKFPLKFLFSLREYKVAAGCQIWTARRMAFAPSEFPLLDVNCVQHYCPVKDEGLNATCEPFLTQFGKIKSCKPIGSDCGFLNILTCRGRSRNTHSTTWLHILLHVTML